MSASQLFEFPDDFDKLLALNTAPSGYNWMALGGRLPQQTGVRGFTYQHLLQFEKQNTGNPVVVVMHAWLPQSTATVESLHTALTAIGQQAIIDALGLGSTVQAPLSRQQTASCLPAALREDATPVFSAHHRDVLREKLLPVFQQLTQEALRAVALIVNYETQPFSFPVLYSEVLKHVVNYSVNGLPWIRLGDVSNLRRALANCGCAAGALEALDSLDPVAGLASSTLAPPSFPASGSAVNSGQNFGVVANTVGSITINNHLASPAHYSNGGRN